MGWLKSWHGSDKREIEPRAIVKEWEVGGFEGLGSQRGWISKFCDLFCDFLSMANGEVGEVEVHTEGWLPEDWLIARGWPSADLSQSHNSRAA